MRTNNKKNRRNLLDGNKTGERIVRRPYVWKKEVEGDDNEEVMSNRIIS